MQPSMQSSPPSSHAVLRDCSSRIQPTKIGSVAVCTLPLFIQVAVILIGRRHRLRHVIGIQQRQRVLGMLEVRDQVGRGATREALDAWILHDGLVEVVERLREECSRPTVVFAGVPSRRGPQTIHLTFGSVEDHVVSLKRIHSEVVHSRDGAQGLAWSQP